MEVGNMEITLKIKIDEDTIIEVSEAKARVLMQKLEDLFGEIEEEKDNSDFWKYIPAQPQQPPWQVPYSPYPLGSPWAKEGEVTWTTYTDGITDNPNKITTDKPPKVSYNSNEPYNSITIDVANSYR